MAPSGTIANTIARESVSGLIAGWWAVLTGDDRWASKVHGYRSLGGLIWLVADLLKSPFSKPQTEKHVVANMKRLARARDVEGPPSVQPLTSFPNPLLV